MIDGTGHHADTQRSLKKRRTTMFKTISAALLAVSVLAAPAFAAANKPTQTPVAKTTESKATQTKATQTNATQTKATPAKQGALDANAKMSKHHVKHVRHHTKHKMAVHRTHSKVSYKPASHTTTKRG
jgi:hypothetical protein